MTAATTTRRGDAGCAKGSSGEKAGKSETANDFATQTHRYTFATNTHLLRTTKIVAELLSECGLTPGKTLTVNG